MTSLSKPPEQWLPGSQRDIAAWHRTCKAALAAFTSISQETPEIKLVLESDAGPLLWRCLYPPQFLPESLFPRYIAAVANNLIMTHGGRHLSISAGSDCYREIERLLESDYRQALGIMATWHPDSAPYIVRKSTMNADVPDSMVRKQTGELAKHDLQTAGLRLGVDIGNTRTKIALVEDGDIVKLDFMPTLIIEGIKKGPFQFFEDMAHEILRRVGPAKRGQFVTGAGIAWFGDVIRGKPMTQAADLLPWHNPAMQRELSEATQTISNVLQCPVTFYGDSEALAIYLGLTGNFASSYLLILGTSTGGGYFGDDGRYVPGVNLVSRIVIDLDPEAPAHTSTGAPGAFQQYSASYGIRRALELVQLPPGSASLSSLPEGEVLRRLLQSNNQEEKNCGERCVEWLSRWLLAAVSDLHTHYRFNNILLSGGNATEPLGTHIAASLERLWAEHSEEPLSTRVLSSDTQWPPTHEVALAVAHLAASAGRQ